MNVGICKKGKNRVLASLARAKGKLSSQKERHRHTWTAGDAEFDVFAAGRVGRSV